MPTPPRPRRLPRRLFLGLFTALVLSQTFVSFMGAGDQFVVGHNGWNSSAYLQSARNTLRWGSLFPVQYYTGRTPPTVKDGYTHHPLGMHLHNVASVWLFGDHPGSIRAVPALFGVLALIALILVVRLLYDDRTALLAGAIYVVLPTNAIYVNMSNHENGFIFWTFLWGLFYLRFLAVRFPDGANGAGDDAQPPPPRRWVPAYLLMLLSFFWAAMWDWPAYYCAFVFAVHWFAVIIRRHRRGERRLRPLLPDLGLLAGYSLLVLATFVGHFVLVAAIAGSVSDLHGVFEARQSGSATMLAHHFKVVPILMFTIPVLLVMFGWLFVRGWQAVRGRLPRREILALTFGIAGLLHYYIFRGTAVVHEYWGWTLVPFASIACATFIVFAYERVSSLLTRRFPSRRRLWGVLAAALVSLLVLGNLGWRFVELVPAGRAVGGSLWFVADSRPVREPYVSNREMVRFAEEVKARTTRHTGVIIDPALERIRGYEPRVPITLDREVVFQTLKPPPADRQLGITEGWVYLAPPRLLSERRILELARAHPVLVYDDFVMVDLRSSEGGIEVIRNEPAERSAWAWFWRGPWSDAVAPVHQPEDEERLRRALAKL